MENINDILHVDATATTATYRKGTVIQHAGDRQLHTFFVKKGLLRSYIIDSKGKEHIFMFAAEGWIIADIESLEFGGAAELYIDCLEDSEVVMFDKNCLFMEAVDSEMLVRNFKLLYRRMGVLQRRVIMQMSAPAADRYAYFIKTYPALLHRIPQHMIASYLGITPQALSTIRTKIATAKG